MIQWLYNSVVRGTRIVFVVGIITILFLACLRFCR